MKEGKKGGKEKKGGRIKNKKERRGE